MNRKMEMRKWIIATMLVLMMTLAVIPLSTYGGEITENEIYSAADAGGLVLKSQSTIVYGKGLGYVYHWDGTDWTYCIYSTSENTAKIYQPNTYIEGSTLMGGAPSYVDGGGGSGVSGSRGNGATFIGAGLLLYGNVSVKSDGILTFKDNSEIVINSTYEGEHHLNVEDATFRLQSKSRIWAWSPYKYDFIAHNATLNMTTSEIRDIRNFEVDSDSSMYMEYCSLTNTSQGMHLKNMKEVWLLNNTGDRIFVENSTANAVFSKNDDTTLLNTTVKRCGSNGGNLTIEWYLDVTVVDSNGKPVDGAPVFITDNTGSERRFTTGPRGTLKWIVLPEKKYFSNGVIDYSPYTIYSEIDGKSAQITLDLNESKSVTLVLGSDGSPGEVPDLSVSSEDISFEFKDMDHNGLVCRWEEVIINADIHNIGPINASATVSFYLDSTSPESLIYREYDVPVPAEGVTRVSYDWTTKVEGNHSIVVNITDSSPPEQNLTNNEAEKSILIDSSNTQLKVNACTDKQVYKIGSDKQATVIVKVTSDGQMIENATVYVSILEPDNKNTSVSVNQRSPGIYVGVYGFSNDSLPGTYLIKVHADKQGYVSGENNEHRDKFFLDSSYGGCPNLENVSLSSNVITISDKNLTISAKLDGVQGRESVFAELKKHKESLCIRLPLYDDGTHSDLIAGDGTFTSTLETIPSNGTFVVDIVVDGMRYENREAFVVDDGTLCSLVNLAYSESEDGHLEIESPSTNITVNLNLVEDISNISFTLVERQTNGSGKSMEIIPTSNVDTAMIDAGISVKYTEEDIPDGVGERDMRIHVFDIYDEDWEVCSPGYVDQNDNTIYGKTKHFSNFTIQSAPYLYSSSVHSGWNLLTLPWLSSPQSIEDALYSVSWDRAMVYQNGQWYTYNKNRDAKYNIGFPEIDNTMGVWVNITSGETMSCRYDEPINSTELHLNKGWNLIGYPSASDSKVSDVFSGIPWEIIRGADANGNMYSLSSQDYLISGRSYWIYVQEECDIIVQW